MKKSKLDEILFEEKFSIVIPVSTPFGNVRQVVGQAVWETVSTAKTMIFDRKGFDSASQAYNSAVYRELEDFLIISYFEKKQQPTL